MSIDSIFIDGVEYEAVNVYAVREQSAESAQVELVNDMARVYLMRDLATEITKVKGAIDEGVQEGVGVVRRTAHAIILRRKER